MSLTVEFLKEYFARPDITQSDYAKTAGIDPSLLTKLMQEEVLVSSKNLKRLLRGFHEYSDKLAFLNAYLRDQVPDDFNDAISIRLIKAGTITGAADEFGESEEESALLQAFQSLPPGYRPRIIRFTRQLARDGDLRRFFSMTMNYVDDGARSQRESGKHLIYADHKNTPTEGLPPSRAGERKKKKAGSGSV